MTVGDKSPFRGNHRTSTLKKITVKEDKKKSLLSEDLAFRTLMVEAYEELKSLSSPLF